MDICDTEVGRGVLTGPTPVGVEERLEWVEPLVPLRTGTGFSGTEEGWRATAC